VVDNAGKLDISCWGGVLATGASLKGISGVVIDGACRDVDDYVALDFSVYARGKVVATARGRAVEENTNITVQFGGVQVRPRDVIIADRSGVAVIPQERFEQVLEKAWTLYQKEEAMCADLRAGMTSLQVDIKYGYEKMLKE
jgi:4-hydroxy-4-methyl-2-oxoglutarate aldolase